MSRPLGGTELKRLHRQWRRDAPGRVALLLDSVSNPFNVGAILRSAAAMRVDDVFLCGRTAGENDAGTHKTALGSQRYLRFHHHDSAGVAIAAVAAAGYRLVGIELTDDAVALHEADLGGSVCLAVGHEDRGLSAEGLAAAETIAFVPQLGRVASLNVATAASIALYEARRQGWGEPGADSAT